MKGNLLRKSLVVGVAILFIGICILPIVSSKDESIRNRSIEQESDSGDKGLGFILCRVTYFEIGIWIELGLPGQNVKCINIDTGEVVRQGKTRVFGFYLFKFLPMGRDYKIIADTIYGKESKKVEDLFLFQKVEFTFITK